MSVTDSLTDAGGLTRRYLTALGFGGVLKLGVVLALLGSVGIANQVLTLPVNPELIDQSPEPWTLAGVSAVALLIYGAFRYVAAVGEFVFVESLRSEALALRTYARANLRSALWLLLFRAALGIGFLAIGALPVAWVVVSGGVTDPTDLTLPQGVGIGVAALVAFVGQKTATTLTTGFVVPIMLQEGRGPISGWRRLVGSMRESWTAAAGFLLVAWVIGVGLWVGFSVIGFVAGIVGLFVFVVIASAVTEISAAFEPVVVVAFILGLLSYRYALATLSAPVRSYVRYYALVVLGDSEPTLDLIGDQRRAVRPDETDDALQSAVEAEQADDDSRDPDCE